MRRILAAAAGICLALGPAQAAKWTVDRAKSRLGFTVSWSGEAFNAAFKSWKADIDFDPAHLATSRAVVAIDLGSEESGSPDNDDGVKGAEGFAITQFPTARFTTTGFKATGGNGYLATGTLNLHGVSRVIALPFTLNIAGDTAHMVGKAVVSRLDFGLGSSGEWAGETPIAHAVTITVDLTATKAR